MVKANIFLSYARENSDFVLTLANNLRAEGVNLWLDQLDLVPGERWDQSIQEALTNCKTLLFILSPESVSSQNVMDEVSFALEEGKQVIPVLHIDCDIPFRLRRLQHIDFTGDNEAGFNQLVDSLKIEPSSTSVRPSLAPTDYEKEKLGSGKTYLIGFVAIALVVILGFIAWNFITRGEPDILISDSSKTFNTLNSQSGEKLEKSQPSVQSKLLHIDAGPYHLGDETLPEPRWSQPFQPCYKIDLFLDSTVQELELVLETYGVENSSIRLNGQRVASLPRQPNKTGEKRPNYWSKSHSIVLSDKFTKLGLNKFSLCTEPVSNPTKKDDMDDFQIRNLKIIAKT